MSDDVTHLCRIGSLFSGIGGLELGLVRAGVGQVTWQVEKDPACQRVLRKHWPQSIIYDDICTANVTPIDVLCGGFPCQDISQASSRSFPPGLAGVHSGLWSMYREFIAILNPHTVVIENVASGKQRWLSQVRRDLHMLGYRSIAIALSALDCGALHKRARVFIVAHPYRNCKSTMPQYGEAQILCNNAKDLWDRWPTEPSHLRVANGISDRVDRDRMLGNSVCPYMSQAIGNAIVGGWTFAVAY